MVGEKKEKTAGELLALPSSAIHFCADMAVRKLMFAPETCDKTAVSVRQTFEFLRDGFFRFLVESGAIEDLLEIEEKDKERFAQIINPKEGVGMLDFLFKYLLESSEVGSSIGVETSFLFEKWDSFEGGKLILRLDSKAQTMSLLDKASAQEKWDSFKELRQMEKKAGQTLPPALEALFC